MEGGACLFHPGGLKSISQLKNCILSESRKRASVALPSLPPVNCTK